MGDGIENGECFFAFSEFDFGVVIIHDFGEIIDVGEETEIGVGFLDFG